MKLIGPVLSFLLFGCASVGIEPLLHQFEGIYSLIDGDYPECAQRPYVEVHYRHASRRLRIDPIDREDLERRPGSNGWRWLEFADLNGEAQIETSDFGLITYERSTAREIDPGWAVRQYAKRCQMRILCGGWNLQESVLLSGDMLQMNLRADTEHCTYRKVGKRTENGDASQTQKGSAE